MADQKLSGLIEFILKDAGLLEAQAKVKSLTREVAASKAEMTAFSKASDLMTSSFRSWVAPAAVFAFVAKQTADWALFERQLRATAITLRALGIDADQAIPRVTAFLDSIAEATGIVDDDTLPAFQKLVGITRNVDAALAGTRLAAGIARSGMMDIGQAAEAVAAILNGKMGPAVNGLGIRTKEVDGSMRSASEVLDEARAKFDSLADGMAESESGAARMAAGWDKLGDSIGRTFLPIFDAGKAVIGEFFSQLADGLERSKVRILAFSTGLGAMFAPLNSWRESYAEAFRGYEAELDAMISGQTEAIQSTEQLYAELKKVADLRDAAEQAKAKEQQDKALAAAQKSLLDSQIALAKEGTQKRLELEIQANEAARAVAIEGAAGSADAILTINEVFDNKRRAIEGKFTEFQTAEAEKRTKAEQKAAEERAKAEQSAVLAALRSQRDLAGAGTFERLALTERVLDAEMEAELAGTEQTEREKQAIRERYANQRIAAERDFLDKLYSDIMSGLEREAEVVAERAEFEQNALDELRRLRQDDYQRQIDELVQFGEWITEEKVRQALVAVEEVEAAEKDAALAQYQDDLAFAIKTKADTFAITMAYLRRTENAERASAEARKRIELSVQMQKIAVAQMASQFAHAANTAFFNDNKKVAAALAVIDGVIAGMESFWRLGGPENPLAWAALALGIATGVAQGAAIMKVQPGDTSAGSAKNAGGLSGGSRPSGNDDKSRGNVAPPQMAASGPPAQSATSTTYDNSTGQVIHVHGAFIDSDSLRGLSRKLKQVERDDSARFQR